MRAQVRSNLFTETILMGGVWTSGGLLKTLCRVNETPSKRLIQLSCYKRGDIEPRCSLLRNESQKNTYRILCALWCPLNAARAAPFWKCNRGERQRRGKSQSREQSLKFTTEDCSSLCLAETRSAPFLRSARRTLTAFKVCNSPRSFISPLLLG